MNLAEWPVRHPLNAWSSTLLMFDGGIACQTLCLAAWGEGLGSCIMGIYDEEKLPSLLEVPEDQYVTAVVSIGYPAESPNAPKRKALEEKVRYV